jgi:hypothetical protein
MDCTSYAVIPRKTKAIIAESAVEKRLFATNIFTILAMIMPKTPIMRNEPIEVKSIFVVYPTKLITKKIEAVIAKMEAMLSRRKPANIIDVDSPIIPAKATNASSAPRGDSLEKTYPKVAAQISGANKTTQYSGVLNMIAKARGELAVKKATTPETRSPRAIYP